jgi:hydrogenase maturation protease
LHFLLDALSKAVDQSLMTLDDPGEARPKILVAAIGNPDRGDDGVGQFVAQRLSGRLPPDAKLVARAGDLMSLIDDWAGVDAVICVDASAQRGVPGRICRIDLAEEALPPDLSFTSSHAFGLAEAIELARVLELAPKRIIVYAIEGACFDTGAPFTPAVLSAATEVADLIAGEVRQILAAASGSKHGKHA